jgi:hypothetical protein
MPHEGPDTIFMFDDDLYFQRQAGYWHEQAPQAQLELAGQLWNQAEEDAEITYQ